MDFYNDNFRKVIIINKNTHTLRIEDAQESHTGNYTCGGKLALQLIVIGKSLYYNSFTQEKCGFNLLL